ncbi:MULTISPECIES: hypothetical protein [unclassified Pseudofrankia]|uniref:hypothetical protein n=1 Tax=unclassified Pseudofrankia TaxID=2994372 RepID=UPI0008DAAE63|nr:MULTISPECIES: hypothetical protein [unclassified Pseudofrankia]MDT3438987.1 hypothetical protein [Pseudofrankia sp. BMG5.37]OHV50594.1 hypothetical protein BCD48_01045 [Pseudofrankia sp. BMG5.36]
MLYLAGQILAFMLVALVLGAALAWVFLIGPIRRQRPAFAGVGAAAAMPASGRVRGPAVLAATTNVSVLGGVGRARTAEPDRATREQVPTADREPASPELAGHDLDDLVKTDLVPAEAELADLLPVGFAPVDAVPLEAGPLEQVAAGQGGNRAGETPGTAEAEIALGEIVESVTAEDESAGSRIAGDESVQGEVAGDESAAGEVAERVTAPDDAFGGAGADAGRAALDEDRIAVLTVRLRRQEERSSAENADLASRLAAAELWATASESRVSAAERQAANAAVQVGAAQARMAQIEAELRGEAEGRDGQAGHLQTALAEAETRAARFSARLATVRTEAEEAAHQTAALAERLERRQAEWAAERAGLLRRIAEVEALAASWAAGATSTRVDTADGLDLPTGAASVDGMDGVDGMDDDAPAGGAPVPAAPAAQDMAVPEILGAADEAATPEASREAVGAEAVDAETVVSAAVPAAPHPAASDAAAPLPAPAAQAAKVPPAAAGGRSRPEPAEKFPSWGGLAEPVVSTDNLKEIVGVGQVIEARLRGLGITSFRQLATMGDTDVERLAARLEGFGSRIVSDDWVGQARELQVRYHNGL